MPHTFIRGEQVLFNPAKGSSLPGSADSQIHTVKSTLEVDKFVASPLFIAGLVGHPQWVTLENGRTYTGAYLLPYRGEES